jgi:steroid delta-isomerase-like uncharacterized protein
MSIAQNKAVVSRFYEEVWNKWNMSVLEEIFATNWVYHDAGGMELKGMDGFKQFLTMHRTAYPDFQMQVEEMIAEGDKVVSRITAQGTLNGPLMGLTPTGKHFKSPIVEIHRFVGSKLAETYEFANLLDAFQQIGIIPPMSHGKA